EYDVISAGFKYNLSDIAAAIGRVQLRRCDSMHRRRHQIHSLYEEAFSRFDCLSRCPVTEFESAHHLYTVELPDQRMRDEFNRILRENGIGTGLHFIPLYRMTYYKEKFGLVARDYPACEE